GTPGPGRTAPARRRPEVSMGAGYALAVATGLVAAVNPCGFALLPAYLSVLILDEAPTRRAALGRALALTAAMTAGFVLVFGAFGLLFAPVAGQVGRHLPWFAGALARMSLVARLRRAGPVLVRIGGLLLAVAGGYVAYYGWYSLRVFGGRAVHDPVVDAVSRVQERLTDRLDTVTVAVAFAVLLAVAATAAVAHRRR